MRRVVGRVEEECFIKGNKYILSKKNIVGKVTMKHINLYNKKTIKNKEI